MALPLITPTYTGVATSAGDFVLQVDTASNTVSPAWVSVFGMKTFTPGKTDNSVDVTDFDSGGWAANQFFGAAWSWTLTVSRKLYNGAQDVGQEFLRTQNFAQALAHCRYFQRSGGPEAYEGLASVGWEPQGGGRNDERTVNVTLSGNGALVPIANPIAVNTAPVVAAATPSGAAAGAVVGISGSFFTGATQVKFGATNATAFLVNSDTSISAIVPAGTAGAAAITVVNPTGTSNALPYTRG